MIIVLKPSATKDEIDHIVGMIQKAGLRTNISAGETQTIITPGQELYLGEVEDMADAILLGKAPRVSVADSRGNVASLLALLRSAHEGKPVSVNG